MQPQDSLPAVDVSKEQREDDEVTLMGLIMLAGKFRQRVALVLLGLGYWRSLLYYVRIDIKVS